MLNDFRSYVAVHRIVSLIALFMVVLSLALFTACSPTSHECKDGDANGRCDTCGEAVSPSCSGHLDTDRSGTCDECGEELDTECGLHEDNDKNGYCDFCGRVYDSDEESGDFSDLLPPSDVDLPFDPFV